MIIPVLFNHIFNLLHGFPNVKRLCGFACRFRISLFCGRAITRTAIAVRLAIATVISSISVTFSSPVTVAGFSSTTDEQERLRVKIDVKAAHTKYSDELLHLMTRLDVVEVESIE